MDKSTKPKEFTTNELMAVTASRMLEDGQNVVVGIGLPQVATLLAKKTHAPNLTIIYEIGVTNPESVDPGVGLADPRYWYKSEYYTGFVGTLGQMLQRRLIDVGFLGGLQVDRFGNINSTLVKTDKGIRHFTGSGGAADIATYAKKLLIIIKHQKRKIVEAVEHLTTIGYLRGKQTREEEGLPSCQQVRVITNLCVFGFSEKDRSIEIESIHPGVSADEVVNNTGVALRVPKTVRITAEPTEEEVSLLRTSIDPGGLYI